MAMENKLGGDNAEGLLRWLKIKKEVDLLALTALLISVFNVVYLLTVYVRGHDLDIMPPEQVLIHYSKYANESYVQFGSVMAYANSGGEGYDALVVRELMLIGVGGRCESRENSLCVVQGWQKFVHIDSEVEELEDGSSAERLKILRVSSAAPFSVPGSGAISHETYFSPIWIKCATGTQVTECDESNFLKVNTFAELIEPSESNDKKITVVLIASIHESDLLEVACEVEVDENVRYELAENGWSSPPCWVDREWRMNRDLKAEVMSILGVT